MRRIEREHVIHLKGPVERVFPLFTPMGETLWVEGWNPEYLFPETGRTERGMVFRTGEGDELTLWTCADFWPEARHVRYVRVTPASRFGTVDVMCKPLDLSTTEATIRYVFTALNEKGDAVLRALTDDAFRAMIEGWREAIDAWLLQSPNVIVTH
jgi:hypothetical protein